MHEKNHNTIKSEKEDLIFHDLAEVVADFLQSDLISEISSEDFEIFSDEDLAEAEAEKETTEVTMSK